MKLTREQILQGPRYSEEFEVEELGGSVTIRALTDAEVARIERISISCLPPELRKAAQSSRGNPTMDMVNDQLEVLLDAERQVNRMAAAAGLSTGGDTWSEEDVDAMPPGVPAKIGARVMSISGMGKGAAEEARNFRPQHGGQGDSGVDVDGRATGAASIAVDSRPAYVHSGVDQRGRKSG